MSNRKLFLMMLAESLYVFVWFAGFFLAIGFHLYLIYYGV